MLEAVTDAQDRLRNRGLTRFETIQIIDQREDEAHTIWHALRRLAHPANFELQPEVEYRAGASRRIAAVEDPESWRAVQIESTSLAGGGSALRFTVAGDVARAESYVTASDPNFLKAFIDSATRGGIADSVPVSPSRALYEMIWPDGLKQSRHEDRNLRLILDEAAAALPLELLDDRRFASEGPGWNIKPPAVRHGLLRQLVRQDFARRQPSGAAKPAALVIGDPRGGPVAVEFHPLPGAREEARAVADRLSKAGYEVTALIGDEVTPAQVVEHVLRGGWTILHVASHGAYYWAFKSDRDEAAAAKTDPKAIPRYTGIVLGDRMVLSPATLQSLPDPPALAFINCCDLGTIDVADEDEVRQERRPQFAASFAAELIALGAQAVIAAGWEVKDNPALAFATTFYDGLLGAGLGFGDATRAAREAAYDSEPGGVTWGAYQCYGEPDWRPRLARGVGRRRPARLDLASPAEAVAALESLISLANLGAGRDARRKRIRDQLGAVQLAMRRKGWLARPQAVEALGHAFAALDETDLAIGMFEQALALPAQPNDSGPALRAVETLANLRIKQAVGLAPAAALSQIAAARRTLERLCEAVGESGERLSLIGGAFKREAELSAGPARDKALAVMGETYRRAWDLSHRLGDDNPYYPGQVVVTANALVRLRAGAAHTDQDEQDLAGFLADLDAAGDRSDDYDHHAARAAHRLLDHLGRGALSDATRSEVCGVYAAVRARCGTDQQFHRTLRNMDFIAEMLGEMAASKPAADWVRAIRAGLPAPS
jgi:CHAT domain-containing protein